MTESLRVLLVEDQAAVRRGIVEILRAAFPGVKVVEAGDGAEALQICLTEAWDIILLDIALPKRSGVEVLRKVKQHRPDQRVLMLSMYARPEYVLLSLKLGATGYVEKEALSDELEPAIRLVLEGGTYLSRKIAAWFKGKPYGL